MQSSLRFFCKAGMCIFFLSSFIGVNAVYSRQEKLPQQNSFLSPPYAITTDTAPLVILPRAAWQILPDANGRLTLNDVLRSRDFNQSKGVLNYRHRVYWIRYRLVNKMSHDIRIGLPEEAARADIYLKTDSSSWQHFKTGTLVRWSNRDGLKRIPAFTLTIPAGETVTVYKRLYWNFVAAQPDSMSVLFAPTEKLILQNYVKNDTILMTSIQDAFILGLFILSMIISFYFYLVVREKEFLYFSLYLLIVSLQAIPSLNDAFLREYPKFLLYLYIIPNSFEAFMLIHFLRRFLKIVKRFPVWDKFLIIFSFLQVFVLLASHFASSILHTNLGAVSHFSFNLSNMLSGIIVLVTLFLYLRDHHKATRLIIVALTPILCLKVLVYLLFIIYNLYSPGFGEPTLHGYELSFNKAAFFILILCFLWMVSFFDWVLFLRFSNIRKDFIHQTMLDRMKSRFFANISHEFRTPLTLIIGPLEDRMQGEDPEKLMRLVPAMHRNSKRLLQLINQLLDLSKLDSGNHHLNTTRKDIIPFTGQIVHSFSSMAERKDICLDYKVDHDLNKALDTDNISFYFDEDVMEKIITNLLSNALKFTETGGEITVSLTLVKDKQDHLELRVADNGKGIPAEKLPYIFERFYQADHSTKRLYEGNGIGLSLVKELVLLHEGNISVSSLFNKGTVFTCLFPFNKKIQSGEVNAPNIKPHQTVEPVMESEDEISLQDNDILESKSIILIVEDNEDVRKYIHEKLAGTYSILEASNGVEGLQIALDQIPDLIISDVMMPEKDGFELCKRIKTDNRTCHIPVILLTARAEDEDKMTGLETGADAYLVKPFNARELRIRVDHLITLRKKLRTKFSGKLIVRPGEITITSRDNELMEKLCEVTEKHISDAHFSVDQLSAEMNMSNSQLSRKLKALINQPPHSFIRSIRMQRSLELLKNDAGTISEISFRVGFEDPGYFSKVFKRYFGCLPTEREKFPD